MVDGEVAGEAAAWAEVACCALQEEAVAAELLLDELARGAGEVWGEAVALPAGGGGVAGVVDDGGEGAAVFAVEAEDLERVVGWDLLVDADDALACGGEDAAVAVDAALALGGSDANGLQVLEGLRCGFGDLPREIFEVGHRHVEAGGDVLQAEGVGAGVGVAAGETDVGLRDGGSRRYGVEDLRGPFGVESDGVGVEDEDAGFTLCESEGGGVERHVRAGAALVESALPSHLAGFRGRA